MKTIKQLEAIKGKYMVADLGNGKIGGVFICNTGVSKKTGEPLLRVRFMLPVQAGMRTLFNFSTHEWLRPFRVENSKTYKSADACYQAYSHANRQTWKVSQ